MVTMATEKRAIDEREAAVEFDGRWLLLDKNDFPPSEDMGYIIAYGNGTPEDRDVLRKINLDQYDGDLRLMKGYTPKDEVYDCGIIEEV
ncbi:MAG: hypothetical protein FWB85_08125 [Chitinispirillia bacterium]|nr:hypothetical protein [Chitinispirillia bacterium]